MSKSRFQSAFIWIRVFFSRLTRVIKASYVSFSDDQCFLKASALTFYSLLSIVPVLAVALGIAKGFGFAERLETEILDRFQDNPDFAKKMIEFTYSMLDHAQGGLIGGIGTVILFWSGLKLLNNIETALNDIWKVNKPRTLSRKFSDYLATLIIIPVVFVISSSLSVFVVTQITQVSKETGVFETISPLIDFGFYSFPFVLSWFLFAVLYGFMPNTYVSRMSALIAGIFAGTVYQISQIIYIHFQVGAASYGAIYGSFAALPLFLIWLNFSWQVVLAGAEVCYQLDNDVIPSNLTPKNGSYQHVKASPLDVAFFLVQQTIKTFKNGESLNLKDFSTYAGLPLSTAEEIAERLVSKKILVELIAESGTHHYHPSTLPSQITPEKVSNAMNRSLEKNLSVFNSPEFQNALKHSIDEPVAD